MLLRIIGFTLLFCCQAIAFASENRLLAVKPMLLPDSRVRLDFQFSKPVQNPPASFLTEKPIRIVLDFPNTQSEIRPAGAVQPINLGSLIDYKIVNVNNRVRVILNLSNSVSYSTNTTSHQYTLILSGKSEQIYENQKQIFITNQPVNAFFNLRKIDFRGMDKRGQNGGRIIVNLSHTSVPVDVKQTGRELVVNFQNTRAPKPLLKRYDVSDFNTPAQLMSLKQTGSNVKLKVVNKGDYGHFSYQVNKQFILDIFPLTEEQIKRAKLKKKIFTGKRISLNFQKIQVGAVLQLLADFAGTNIVVGSGVGNGEVTLRLNDVPWDQALDIILTTQNLGKRENGNIIFVDSSANISAREIEDLKNQQEVIKQEPLRSDLIQINYAKATEIASMLKDKDTSLLSARGTVSVDVRTNAIWIQDTGAQIEIVRELIKKLDIPVRQVSIESRIVTVDKDFTQDIGIRWGISKPNSLSGTLNAANQMQDGAAPAAVIPFTERLNLDLAAQPTGAPPASVGIALARLGDGILLDLELSALESELRGEVIASPRLITSNQQPAVIESGTEIPYQEATSSGATAVAFKKAVLSLSVIPQITPDNKIMMILKINQDRPGAVTNGVPAIDTKQIQTNVLVNNGQTIVLGGIYQQDRRNTLYRIPFFGDLPIVGYMFRNTQILVRNEELLIFITPRIITNALSITTAEGQKKCLPKGVELDKFGNPVNILR